MAFTFNGIGTTFYGKRDQASDGSYVTTEWFVILYFPIFPIRSLRVRPSNTGKDYFFYSSQGYLSQGTSLNFRQIINVYAVAAIIVLLIIAFIKLL